MEGNEHSLLMSSRANSISECYQKAFQKTVKSLMSDKFLFIHKCEREQTLKVYELYEDFSIISPKSDIHSRYATHTHKYLESESESERVNITLSFLGFNLSDDKRNKNT